MISQPDATDLATTLFKLVYILSGLYAFISIIRYAIYIAFPVLSVPVQRLRCYGKPREILAEAEEELATLPQLATEDMFITEHYFIETVQLWCGDRADQSDHLDLQILYPA